MHSFKLLYVAAVAPLLISAASITDTPQRRGNDLDTVYVTTALESFEKNATTHSPSKRLSINDCLGPINAAAGALNSCFELANNLRALGSTIGSVIYTSSSNKDCTLHTGTVDGVQWRYSATGEDCTTNAQLKTIRGAVDAWLKAGVEGQCKNVCLRMTHGGTWTGYVSLTPPGGPAPKDCSTAAYGSCQLHGDGSDLGARDCESDYSLRMN